MLEEGSQTREDIYADKIATNLSTEVAWSLLVWLELLPVENDFQNYASLTEIFINEMTGL